MKSARVRSGLIAVVVFGSLFALRAFAKPNPTVYVAGSSGTADGSPLACYWVNGVRTDLADGAEYEASALCVSAGKVYVTGTLYSFAQREYVCAYWVDGKRVAFSDGKDSWVNYIFVSGKTIYLLGGHEGLPCYWVNGVRTALPGDGVSGHWAYAGSLFVSKGKVYALGAYNDGTTDIACYWVNGVRKDLPGGTAPGGASANSIFVSDATVYVAGSSNNGSQTVACLWVNGIKSDLPGGTDPKGSDAKSVFVAASTVYVAGGYRTGVGAAEGGRACYWTNGVKTDLPGDDATSIQVIDGKIYAAGSFFNSEKATQQACYWVDGQRVELPSQNAGANCIFVQ